MLSILRGIYDSVNFLFLGSRMRIRTSAVHLESNQITLALRCPPVGLRELTGSTFLRALPTELTLYVSCSLVEGDGLEPPTTS